MEDKLLGFPMSAKPVVEYIGSMADISVFVERRVDGIWGYYAYDDKGRILIQDTCSSKRKAVSSAQGVFEFLESDLSSGSMKEPEQASDRKEKP